MNDWDQNDEWEVHRTFHARAVLVVILPDKEKATSLAKLRRIIPEFRNTPPAALLRKTRDGGELHLDEMTGREAHRLEKELIDAGIQTRRVDTSVVSFLPFNRTKGYAWLIESSVESERIARKMISEGVKVVNAEA